MIGVGVYTLLATGLQLTVPSYALRLVRRFGAENVGWFVVLAFVSLGAMYLLTPFIPIDALGMGSSTDPVYIMASGLLLLGMGHLEGVCSERLRVQHEQQKSAGLTRANQMLVEEIERRQAAEKALATTETQYRSMFADNPLPMWVFDRVSYHFLAVNEAALRHYGYTRDEFMAINARDLVPTDDADAFMRDAASHCSGTVKPRRWRYLKKDLGVVEVEVSTADLDFGDRPARLVMAVDISRSVSRERVAREAQKMAMLRQVAGGVAHHFNNILTVIECHTSLMQLNRRFGDSIELAEVAKAARRGAAITRQLLIASGQHPLKREPIELNVMLLMLNPRLCRLIGDKIVFQHTSYATQLPLIMADPSLVEQVIINLVLNACEAMPCGGTLTLNTSRVRLDPPSAPSATEEGSQTGEYVCVAVRDSGCGMTPEVRGRLFEPFFTTHDVGQSFGLGLASVYGVVRQHGGRVEVVSEPGVGTEVRAFFPSV